MSGKSNLIKWAIKHGIKMARGMGPSYHDP
jgi:hypothetical protein